jgi:hypothetical protein
MPEPAGEPLRLVDILTTASAVTSYLGASGTTAAHVLAAVAILQGRTSMEDLGRPVSPLGRSQRGEPTVTPALRALVQRWFADLGGHGDVALDGDAIEQFLADLQSLEQQAPPG